MLSPKNSPREKKEILIIIDQDTKIMIKITFFKPIHFLEYIFSCRESIFVIVYEFYIPVKKKFILSTVHPAMKKYQNNFSKSNFLVIYYRYDCIYEADYFKNEKVFT